jgi:hypothetical protein
MDEGQLRPINRLSLRFCDRQVVSLCRQSRSVVSTSAIWRIADGANIEQQDGRFVRGRTPSLDRERSPAALAPDVCFLAGGVH